MCVRQLLWRSPDCTCVLTLPSRPQPTWRSDLDVRRVVVQPLHLDHVAVVDHLRKGADIQLCALRWPHAGKSLQLPHSLLSTQEH